MRVSCEVSHLKEEPVLSGRTRESLEGQTRAPLASDFVKRSNLSLR